VLRAKHLSVSGQKTYVLKIRYLLYRSDLDLIFENLNIGADFLSFYFFALQYGRDVFVAAQSDSPHMMIFRAIAPLCVSVGVSSQMVLCGGSLVSLVCGLGLCGGFGGSAHTCCTTYHTYINMYGYSCTVLP
jgi:hypothetical protein